MIPEYDLRPIWDALLDVYKEFAKVCEQHGLRYWVAYGSVLGAVRHKGFIPWDDDLDVCMLREDYEKFLRIAIRELPPHLKIVTYKNTPEFNNNIFAKIQDSREDVIDAISRASGLSLRGGIFLDIFPLEGYPVSLLQRVWYDLGQGIRNVIFDGHYKEWQKASCLHRKFYLCVCRVLSRTFGSKWGNRMSYLHSCEQKVVKFLPESSRFVGRCAPELGGLKRKKPREWFDTSVMLDFRGMKVPCPCEPEKYLSMIYGDYMELPPVEKRCVAHGAGAPCPWRLGPTTEKSPF